MNKLLLSAVLLCGSLQATALTEVQISWNIMEISSGNYVCGGQLFVNFTGTVCDGVVQGFAGFEIDVLATAAEAPGFVFAEVLNRIIVPMGLDSLVYNWELSAFATASVTSAFLITGGEGDAFFNAFGSAGGGQSGAGSEFQAGSGIAGFPCGQAFSPCTEWNPHPFTFGSTIDQGATAMANTFLNNTNGENMVSESSAQGVAGTTVDSIFDAAGNPISGVQLVAVGGPSEVPEPGYWLLCGIGGALIVFCSRYYGARNVIS